MRKVILSIALLLSIGAVAQDPVLTGKASKMNDNDLIRDHYGEWLYTSKSGGYVVFYKLTPVGVNEGIREFSRLMKLNNMNDDYIRDRSFFSKSTDDTDPSEMYTDISLELGELKRIAWNAKWTFFLSSTPRERSGEGYIAITIVPNTDPESSSSSLKQ